MASDPLELPGRGCPRRLHCRVLQSPLAGVSDRIFRALVRRWSEQALLFTEMVNATSLELGHGRAKVEELGQETGPIAVQLFDHRPMAMAEAAQRAEAAGAYLIDINMGCPVKKIAKKGGGSGLIRDPQLATRIIKAVTAAVQVPVTVKTQLFQSFNESEVSEQIARMVAMKAATDNATQMSKDLTRVYNRARQSAITTELTEVISGAMALG